MSYFTLTQNINKFQIVIYNYTAGMFKTIYTSNTSLNFGL
jgi:hypothetical protein